MESPTLTELALMADLPSEARHDEVAIRRYIRRCGAFITTTEEDGDAVVEWIDVAAKEHLTTYAKDDLSLTLNDVQHGIVALRCLEHLRNVFAPMPAEPNNVGVREDEGIPAVEPVKDETEPEADSENDEESVANESLVRDPSSPRPGEGDFDRAHDTASLPHSPDTLQDKAISDEIQSHESQHDQDPEPFLEYAVHNWMEHAVQAPEDVVEEIDFNDEFWREDSVARANWWKEWSAGSRYAGVTDLLPLHLAALISWSALLDFLLENGHTDGLQKVDSWGYTPLTWAADRGDLAGVHRLLKAGAKVDEITAAEGPTALGAAANGGYLDVVQYLIEQGANVNVPNENLGSPLYLATSDGSNSETVRELLRHGANVNLKGGWHIRPLNVAAYAGYTDLVHILLERGADVDPDDDYRYGSALGAAARRGHVEIIQDLLQKGWDVNRKLKTYNSPIVAAATYGHAEVVKALLQHQVEGASQVEALEIASKNGRTEVVKNLLESKPNLPHQKAFHYAAMNGRDEIVELLEKCGTNPEMLDMALYDASDQERESTVKILLGFGASPGAEGKE